MNQVSSPEPSNDALTNPVIQHNAPAQGFSQDLLPKCDLDHCLNSHPEDSCRPRHPSHSAAFSPTRSSSCFHKAYPDSASLQTLSGRGNSVSNQVNQPISHLISNLSLGSEVNVSVSSNLIALNDGDKIPITSHIQNFGNHNQLGSFAQQSPPTSLLNRKDESRIVDNPVIKSVNFAEPKDNVCVSSHVNVFETNCATNFMCRTNYSDSHLVSLGLPTGSASASLPNQNCNYVLKSNEISSSAAYQSYKPKSVYSMCNIDPFPQTCTASHLANPSNFKPHLQFPASELNPYALPFTHYTMSQPVSTVQSLINRPPYIVTNPSFVDSSYFTSSVPNFMPHVTSSSSFSPQNVINPPTTNTYPYSVPHSSPFQHQSSFPSSQYYNQMQLMSNHLLEQDLIKKSIESFDGIATKFWSWAGQLESYIGSLQLSPLKTLQLISSYCSGEPQEMISRHLAAVHHVTQEDVDEVWDSLVHRFGSPQSITQELLLKIRNFSPIQGPNQGKQLHDLHDLCKVVLHNIPKCPDLHNLNLASGLEELRRKLPEHIQHEWRRFGHSFENSHHGMHPPFLEFANFIKCQARLQSNKNYETLFNRYPPKLPNKGNVSRPLTRALQTAVSEEKAITPHLPDKYIPPLLSKDQPPDHKNKQCLYHDKPGHSLLECNTFSKLLYPEKQSIVFNLKLCFRCLGHHRVSACKSNVKCEICNLKHATVMHKSEQKKVSFSQEMKDSPSSYSSTANNTFCTNICQNFKGKNCSKTLLVEVSMRALPSKKLICYAILDEQSNTTLVDDRLVEYFGVTFPTQEFSINFVSQNYEMSTTGQLVSGLQVKGINETEIIALPDALSCPCIADTSNEVATPSIVRQHEHLESYADLFPKFNPNAEVLLLIGRNCGRAMATQCLTDVEPYIHKSPLGYSLVGNVCPQAYNSLNSNRVLKTSIVPQDSIKITYNFLPKPSSDDFDVFQTKADDDFAGLSKQDIQFLDIMSDSSQITKDGYIQLPLPLKDVQLPSNKVPVLMRTKSTLKNLSKNPLKLDACLKSMERNIESGFVERVDSNYEPPEGKQWYLPIFPVQQEKKSKVRLVYDASARFSGCSLNDSLLQGPDLNNQLRGVLLRFRQKPIAFGADIESMFSNFKVPKEQRDYLRFFWYDDNNPAKGIVPYRSTGHIFGCTSSPAVATYALKFCASSFPCDEDVRKYIDHSFYVDDGLHSTDTPDEAVKILSRSIALLKSFQIRLHKLYSNSPEVLQCFPKSECASLSTDLPCEQAQQKTLGISWNTQLDTFSINASVSSKPFTKRGILSTINSLYDPFGFVCPVTLQGKLMQRKFLPPKGKNDDLALYGWDDLLPDYCKNAWQTWLKSLHDLHLISISRSFYPINSLHFSRDSCILRCIRVSHRLCSLH